MNSLKRTARKAALLYLLLAITGGFGIMYVPTAIIVANDATATARNLLENEMLFRLAIVSNLASQTIFIFLVLALYQLFKAVNERHARLMVALVIAAVPIAFLNLLNQVIALSLLSGAGFLNVFQPDQLKSLALVFLNLYGDGISVAEIFWGLWLFPFGWLIIKSGFIPRLFGLLLIIACFGYLVNSLVHFLAPAYASIIAPVTAITGTVGEMSIILWFFIKGVKDRPNVELK